MDDFESTASMVVDQRVFMEIAVSEGLEAEEVQQLIPIAGSIQLALPPGGAARGVREATEDIKSVLRQLPLKHRKVILEYLKAIAQ